MDCICLSHNPNAPCYFLSSDTANILLDCSLDMQCLSTFLPQTLVHSERLNSLPGWQDIKLKNEVKICNGRPFIDSPPEICLPEFGLIDISTVDVILVSNYHNIMALPYLVRERNFRGRVFGTEPTLQFGRLLMEELATFVHRVHNPKQATHWRKSDTLKTLPSKLSDLKNLHCWRKIFSMEAVDEAMSFCEAVSFDQIVDLFGGIKVTPRSSGYAIGSSNWTIETETGKKISYIAGSSVLTTHAQAFDTAPLKNSSVVIMTGLSSAPTSAPDSTMQELCNSVISTLKIGGSVFIPCYPTGTIYDIIEKLYGLLESYNYTQVPLYFISPVGDSSLAYSNIYAEWLCQTRQSKVYIPETPFLHSELVKIGRLKQFNNVYTGFNESLRQPCVILCSHPSLRLGDSVHFLEQWGMNPQNCVVLIESDFYSVEPLQAFQPLAMRAVYAPIDVRLTYIQALQTLKVNIQPELLIFPEYYKRSPHHLPHRADLVLKYDGRQVAVKRGDTVQLPRWCDLERVHMTKELASVLKPRPLMSGIAVCPLVANIVKSGNLVVLDKPNSVKSMGKINKLFGKIDPHTLSKALTDSGVAGVSVDQNEMGHVISIQNQHTMLTFDKTGIHVLCEDNEKLRIDIKNTILTLVGAL